MIEQDQSRPQEAEYKALPQGAIAIVRGKSYDRTPGNFRFRVQIGRVAFHQTQAGVHNDIAAERATEGFVIPKGEHAGWVAVQPIERNRQIEVSVCPQDRPTGEVRLVLVDKGHASDKPVRTASVNAAIFTEQGFDLNQENINNHGVTLNPELSQLLYDFQAGQGQFAPQTEA